MYRKRIPPFYFLLLVVIVGVSVYIGSTQYFENRITPDLPTSKMDKETLSLSRRKTNYRFTKPLLSVEITNPSQSLNSVNDELKSLIEKTTVEGGLENAAIFVRNMNTGEWTAINENLKFTMHGSPKMSTMIYYLNKAEKDPALLSKLFRCSSSVAVANGEETYHIKPGKPYSVKELLKFMVAYSDENATKLLLEHADTMGIKSIFSDVGLPVPTFGDTTYIATVRDISKFVRLLFNATYLSPEASDFALSLLSESRFKESLSKSIPTGMMIAHRFGKSNIGGFVEVHDSGIVFCGNSPYVISVITYGTDQKKQTEVISKVSEILFHHFCS